MDDNVMITWSVIEQAEGYTDTIHICARESVADYMRDWCEAIEYDRYVNTVKTWEENGWPGLEIHRKSFLHGLANFYVNESEVIL